MRGKGLHVNHLFLKGVSRHHMCKGGVFSSLFIFWFNLVIFPSLVLSHSNSIKKHQNQNNWEARNSTQIILITVYQTILEVAERSLCFFSPVTPSYVSIGRVLLTVLCHSGTIKYQIWSRKNPGSLHSVLFRELTRLSTLYLVLIFLPSWICFVQLRIDIFCWEMMHCVCWNHIVQGGHMLQVYHFKHMVHLIHTGVTTCKS